MLFKFQLHKGSVPVHKWYILQFFCIRLMMKRLLRLIKRIAIYLKNYIPIVFCVVAFEVIVIPIGIHLGKYLSWIDGFWDLRNFMLTSIIISVVTGILNGELKRHKKLVEQYWMYHSFKFISQEFIRSLCEIVNDKIEIEMDMYLTEKQFALFEEKINRLIIDTKKGVCNQNIDCNIIFGIEKQISREKALVLVFERYYRELENLKMVLLNSKFEGSIEHAVEHIEKIYNEIRLEEFVLMENPNGYEDIDVLKFARSISGAIYIVIADVRRPWRWDIEINRKIETILNQYN